MNNYYQGMKVLDKMYELRDKLRGLAASGLIPEDELFHYFDKAFVVPSKVTGT